MQTLARNAGKLGRPFSLLIWVLTAAKLIAFTAIAITILHASSVLAKNTAADNASPSKPEIVCTGSNLLAKLKSSNKAALARIETEARKVANGNSRFWKIEKPGLKPSWLLGTMHFADPRIVNLPPVIENAFQSAKTVIIENTQILDETAMLAAMAKLRPLMFLTDGSTLEKHYSPETIDQIKKRLKGRGLPFFIGKRMQPWVLATAIVLPMCEIERKQRKQKVLDYLLGERARKEGKKLVGLESVAEQIGAMAGLSFEFHLKSLEDTIQLGTRLDDMMETMVHIYQQGNLGKIWPLMTFLSPGSSSGPGYAAFKNALITKRNKTMAERSLSEFQQGGVFMAVGALHLPGEEGVVQLLKNAGYTITPAL